MRRRCGLRADRNGSGFLESILAIMVISLSLTLVLASFSASSVREEGTEGLERAAEVWKLRVLSILTDDGSTLLKARLGLLNGTELEEGTCAGMRCELVILEEGSETIPLLALGAVPDQVDRCYVLATPVGLDDGAKVLPAILKVIVW